MYSTNHQERTTSYLYTGKSHGKPRHKPKQPGERDNPGSTIQPKRKEPRRPEDEVRQGEGGEGEEGEAARAMTAATKLSNHAPDGAPPSGNLALGLRAADAREP